MRVWLVRHLPAEVAPGTCYGRLDVPARAGAAAQAALLVRLAGCGAAAVWSSPAARCRGLAEGIAARLGVAPRLDARLLELDFGAWEGMRWDAVPPEALDRWAADPAGFAPPGGESGAALLVRVDTFAAAVRQEGADCVVVAHGGPLRVLGALLRDAAPDLLAPAPPLGSVQLVHAAPASSESTAHSARTEAAPRTSPVCPPS